MGARYELYHPGATVEDIEEDSVTLDDLLYELGNRNITVRGGFDGNSLFLAGLHFSGSSKKIEPIQTVTRTYDVLIDIWMGRLARGIPGRVRITTERMILNTAAELQLARNSISSMSSENQVEQSLQTLDPTEFSTFTLPVRGASQGSNEGYRVKRKAPKISSSLMGSSPSARHMEHMSANILPTPEPTPSIRSQASSSTIDIEEDLAVRRLQTFAKLSPQPPLPAPIMGLLSHWSGTSPEGYDWEACQPMTDIMEEPQDKGDQARAKKKRRLKPQQSQQQLQDLACSSSQPGLTSIHQSQPDMLPPSLLSSQPTPRQLNMSQPEPGRFASGARTKKRTGKRPGF